MRVMRSALPVAFLTLVVTGCSLHAPCPPGDDCRWLIDTGAVGLWIASDPEPAAVVRIVLRDAFGISAYVVWERCGAEACSWAPPATGSRLARQDHGSWVVSLSRSAFARDPSLEIVRPLGDGQRLRFGATRVDVERDAVARPDLPTCVQDLYASLAAGARGGTDVVLDGEIELVCRIWLHPDQGRRTMQWHPALHEIARAHACDMAERAFFGHTNPDGIGPNVRARAAGYALPDWYDGGDDGNNIESLALRAPDSSPRQTLQQWLDSPLHRQHVLAETPFKAAQDDTATGYCLGTGHANTPTHYWAFVSAHAAP